MDLAPRQLDLFRQRVAEPESAMPALPHVDETQIHEVSKDAVVQLSQDLASRVASRLGSDFVVQLSVHDNRSTMMSYRRAGSVLHIRVHHMFLRAPDEVVDALALYTGHGKRVAAARLDDYIATQQRRIRSLPRRVSSLETRGRCFDLAEVFQSLNRQHFQDGIVARIGWGRQTARRRRKSIRLGVYDHHSKEIRIHSVLDHPDVPRFFLEYIVFHEMLHQVFPSARDTGRHVHHPKAFRERERSFPKFEIAIAWEREHLSSLLRR